MDKKTLLYNILFKKTKTKKNKIHYMWGIDMKLYFDLTLSLCSQLYYSAIIEDQHTEQIQQNCSWYGSACWIIIERRMQRSERDLI